MEKYERLFDEATASHDPEKLRILEAYYTSGAWREDYEADERGELPPDLKRRMPCMTCWKMVNGNEEVKLSWNT